MRRSMDEMQMAMDSKRLELKQVSFRFEGGRVMTIRSTKTEAAKSKRAAKKRHQANPPDLQESALENVEWDQEQHFESLK